MKAVSSNFLSASEEDLEEAIEELDHNRLVGE